MGEIILFLNNSCTVVIVCCLNEFRRYLTATLQSAIELSCSRQSICLLFVSGFVASYLNYASALNSTVRSNSNKEIAEDPQSSAETILFHLSDLLSDAHVASFLHRYYQSCYATLLKVFMEARIESN